MELVLYLSQYKLNYEDTLEIFKHTHAYYITCNAVRRCIHTKNFIQIIMKEYSHRAAHAKYSSLQEMIFDRNRMLKDFFVQRGFNVDVIGDPNQPVIVITNFGYKFAVGAFVKNFKYNFTNIPFNGHVVRTIDLNQSNDDFTRDDLIDIFDAYEQREIFVLHKYQEPHFMFNSIVAKYDNKHVYWSETDPHYFLSKQKAEDMKLMLFNEFNIKTVIVPEDEE